mgnify:CR=1 FL=1
MIIWQVIPIVLGSIGVVLAFFFVLKSSSYFQIALAGLMFTASFAIFGSMFFPWVFVPGIVSWIFLYIVFFFICEQKKESVVLNGSAFFFSTIGLMSILLHREFILEFSLMLLQPKACDSSVVTVHSRIPLPSDTPELYESILVLADGSFVVTAATRGEVILIREGKEPRVLAKLPTGSFNLANFNGMLSGITLGLDGEIYTMVLASEPANRGIWRIDAEGGAKLWSSFPPSSSGNGMTSDESGNVYVADSKLGLIWKVGPLGGKPQIWAEHEFLGAGHRLPLPTANGIKLSKGAVFVSNTLQSQLVRVQINKDGGAGLLEVWDSGIAADDFAIDGRERVYLTTHPFNTVVQLEKNKACEIIADTSIGLAGPTAAIFGLGADSDSILYVLNDGGYSRSVEGGRPSIIGLKLEN